MEVAYLKEGDIQQLVTVSEAIDILSQAFQDQAAGLAFATPRQRLRMPSGMLHMMAGSVPGYFGYKAYTAIGGKTQFFLYLYGTQSPNLLAVIEADALGQIRTGAASGLATRLLSNPDANQAALFGAGWQAESQLLALDAVRNLDRVWVVNRSPARREKFIEKMQPRVKAELRPADSPENAVQISQIVTTITTSREPVLRGAWLQPGTHVNAAGGNMLLRRELDDDAVLKAGRVVVDSIEQAKIEAGEFVGVMETGKRRWQDFEELCDVVASVKQAPADITLFKSLGVAIEDVAIGKFVYEKSR
jgi:ornithine cyclodeaminase/alanine dehydrogenase-like protein (mu-crystallin family)